MVWQQARSQVFAQPFWRLFIGDGEDGGEGVDERAVILFSYVRMKDYLRAHDEKPWRCAKM